MRHTSRTHLLIAGVALLAAPASSAFGQELGEGRIVITPGDMVADGFNRAASAVREPFSRTPITETAEATTDPNEQGAGALLGDPQDLIADAVRQLAVSAFSRLFAMIANDFLESLGLPELFPTDFTADLPDLSGLDLPDETGGTDEDRTSDTAGDTGLPTNDAADTDTGRGGRNQGRPRG